MYTPEDYVKGMINMQYSIAHMYYSYWMSYMDGFIEISRVGGREGKSVFRTLVDPDNPEYHFHVSEYRDS